MTDQIFLAVLIILGVLALGFGLWAGLGYPGYYDKYEKTGRAPRGSPWQIVIDWIFDRLIRTRSGQ
ncbi:MAG: hypothetical protein ABFS14_09225 [Gemmatimonadota bacterium]